MWNFQLILMRKRCAGSTSNNFCLTCDAAMKGSSVLFPGNQCDTFYKLVFTLRLVFRLLHNFPTNTHEQKFLTGRTVSSKFSWQRSSPGRTPLGSASDRPICDLVVPLYATRRSKRVRLNINQRYMLCRPANGQTFLSPVYAISHGFISIARLIIASCRRMRQHRRINDLQLFIWTSSQTASVGRSCRKTKEQLHVIQNSFLFVVNRGFQFLASKFNLRFEIFNLGLIMPNIGISNKCFY